MSGIYDKLDFNPNTPPSVPANPVDTSQEIPKELDIFFRQESAFLPEGKELSDLTPKELSKLRAQYRFDPMRPGLYQTITGFQGMI